MIPTRLSRVMFDCMFVCAKTVAQMVESMVRIVVVTIQ